MWILGVDSALNYAKIALDSAIRTIKTTPKGNYKNETLTKNLLQKALDFAGLWA